MNPTSPTKQGPIICNDTKRTLGIYTVVPAYLGGSHSNYLLQHPSGKLFFFKETTWETSCEAAGSHLAHDLTAGQVPKATPIILNGKQGVIQEYVKLDQEPFSPFEAKALTTEQQQDLFVHMITDYVIANYDTHPGQFGLNFKGSVISFDKGFSFGPLKTRDDPTYKDLPKSFDPTYLWPAMIPQRSVYKDFSSYLKDNPTQVRELISCPKVQQCFDRCHKIQRKPQYNPFPKTDEGDHIIAQVIQRAHSVQRATQKYFLN